MGFEYGNNFDTEPPAGRFVGSGFLTGSYFLWYNALMNTDIEEFIQRKLESGEFTTREELSNAAIEMYRDLEEHDALREELSRRIENASAGSVAPLDVHAIKKRLISERGAHA